MRFLIRRNYKWLTAAHLKATMLISAVVLSVAVPLSAQQKPEDPYPTIPHAGSIRDGETHISLSFGIEQFEKGKRAGFRLQMWYLSCSNPDRYSPQRLKYDTWCNLERTIIDNFGDADAPRNIGQRDHSTTDGTLKLTNVDFPNGKLDFVLVLDDASTIEVMMRFRIRKDSVLKGTELFLETFKAVGIAKGLFTDTLEAIEYRIPDYSYEVRIPIQITGMKTADQKVRDDFESSLTQADLATWNKVRDSFFDSEGVMASVKKVIPDFDKIDKGERDFTKAEIEQFGAIMLEHFTTRLAKTTLSSDGKRKALMLFTKITQDSVKNMQKEIAKKAEEK